MSREDAERDLARALSRHIGYTSGAFDLHRIFGVVSFFQNKTSAYTEEIVDDLVTKGGDKAASAPYLAEVINFASSFGLIDAVSNRESKLTRYAATELGRSILGAFSINDAEFQRFFLANVVMLSDADFLVPLMIHIDGHIETPLLDYFCEFADELRSRRYAWMREAFPQPILLERIASRVTWLRKTKGASDPYSVDIPTLNTARHHSRPRLGWLSDLGLSTTNCDRLTRFGTDMLRGVVGDNSYFWIAPPPGAMATLALLDPASGASETDLRLSIGSEIPSDSELDQLTLDVAAVMTSAFQEAKLIHAEQASLRLPIAYVQYRSYKDKRLYDWPKVVNAVFESHRHNLRRYSAHKGQVGFYKVVKA